MKSLLLAVWLGVLSGALALYPRTAGAALDKAVVFEKNVGYLRIGATDKDLLNQIPGALSQFQETNSIAGIVVDLRFANGADTDDLSSIEHLIEQPRLPLAILINAQTSGASAKLAEDLREENSGLVFGSAMQNFHPDIPVPVNTDDEKKFLKDPYAILPHTAASLDCCTNLLPLVDIDHTTEADLVREKIKDGDQDDTTARPAPQKPTIHDPVLARGLDFIKGVAALRLTLNQP